MGMVYLSCVMGDGVFVLCHEGWCICPVSHSGAPLQAGVPRAAYRGVVSFMLKGRRVYLSPPPTWSGYDITWT